MLDEYIKIYKNMLIVSKENRERLQNIIDLYRIEIKELPSEYSSLEIKGSKEHVVEMMEKIKRIIDNETT